MCSICGFTDTFFNNREKTLKAMAEATLHRGPDATGFFTDEYVSFSHNRLAIIDTNTSANQPFFYRDRYVLVFNGEIYNYIELREFLEQKEYTFSTSSDTEVLIACYDYYKEECVKHFNGMWSFCIYDKQEKNLFCSRDRFGIKPFYYTFHEGVFVFASEIKQLKAVLPNLNRVQQDVFCEFLLNGTLDYSEKTMFSNVYQLMGGHNLKYDLATKQHSITQWYNLEEEIHKNRGSTFRQLFEHSLKLRHRSDVPLGYCLSGGLDSSAIVCYTKNITNQQPVCVSACYDNKQVDEQEYIDCVGEKTGAVVHKTFPSSGGLIDELDKIIWYMDEPFGSSSIFAQWEVFKTARANGLKVMLDGQGADEQLAGYNNFFTVLIAQKIRELKFISLFKELYQFKKQRSGSGGVSAVALLASAVVWLFMPSRFDEIKNKYEQKMYTMFKVLPGRKNFVKARNNQYDFSVDCFRNNLSALLHYEDRMSMAFSIESRVPFLDYNLVEHNLSLPIEEKIKNAITKFNMRTELKDILPDKILKRTDKIGFATPEKEWVVQNKDVFYNMLIDACDIIGDGLVNKQEVIDYYNNVYMQSEKNDFVIWRIICAAKWLEIFDMKI